MPTIERASYRAFLAPEASQEQVAALAERVKADGQRLMDEGRILTLCLTRHRDMLFLYIEHIVEAHPDHAGMIELAGFPDAQGWASDAVAPARGFHGSHGWTYMHPVFWFDEPKDVESFRRAQAPDARCGRIAHFWPDTVIDYVFHHQAIAREGLLVGDRYQFISVLDDVAFSYFETPRDREQVNIRRQDQKGEEIDRWLERDPFDHFDHFDPSTKADFLIIDTLVSLG